MKYLLTIIAALGLIAYAFIKGYSVRDHEDDGPAVSPSAPESILSARNPDARYSHCHDKDWDGSTLLRDRLAEAQDRPDVYAILFEGMELRSQLLSVPTEMTPDEDDPYPQPTTQKPSPAHRGSL